MADNTTLNTGSGGDVIRDIDRGLGAKTQVVQLDGGGQSGERLVSTSTPLPVQIMDGGGVPSQVDSAGNQNTTDNNVAGATSADAPLFVSIAGNPGGDFAGVDLLEQVMTDGSGLALNVKILNFPKFDGNGAQVMSDAPVPIQISLGVNQYAVIDTTGYDSLNITTQALAGTITTSNDLVTWSALTGTPLVLGAYVTAVAAVTGYSFPVVARYIKIAATTAGGATAYLRAAPWNPNYTTSVPTANANNNVAQLNGFGVVNAGVNGTLAVGGNVAPGVARTENPLPIAGVDASNLTRTLLTDAAGRQYVLHGGADAAGVSRVGGAFAAAGLGALPSMLTQDASLFEGKTIIELLAQILTELQIANQQRYEMMVGNNSSDDPAAYRADPSIFS